MDRDGAWGSDVETLTFAHLLQTNVYIYTTTSQSWAVHSAHHLDHTIALDFTGKSMYIVHNHNHFEVVTAVT